MYSFWIQNSDYWTRITNLYRSQTSPVVLCIQYSVISIRITCFYGSQPLSVVFACKTASFEAESQISTCPRHDLSFCSCTTTCLASELIVSTGPSPHLWLMLCKTATFGSNLQVSKGTRPHLSFCAGNTACLASEILVSMSPRPHVQFLDAKQRLLDPNNKSLWVPDITCRFVHIIQRD